MVDNEWEVTFPIYLENTTEWIVEKILFSAISSAILNYKIDTTLGSSCVELIGTYKELEILNITLEITEFTLDPETRKVIYSIDGEDSDEFILELNSPIDIMYRGNFTGVSIIFTNTCGSVEGDS